MSPYLQTALVTVVFLGLYLQLAAFVGHTLRQAQGCLCRKHAVSPTCPVHGWERP